MPKTAQISKSQKSNVVNYSPMKQKPIIRWNSTVQLFTINNGDYLPDDKAREIWDAGTGDWSQGAFQEMSRRVMS